MASGAGPAHPPGRPGHGGEARSPIACRWKPEDAAARWVTTRTGTAPVLDHGAFADPRWAGGLRVHVADMSYAVLRPDPRAADWSGLAGLVIFTADAQERPPQPDPHIKQESPKAGVWPRLHTALLEV
ncbi:hypothetical protein [Kitasatospora cathayae]|uniref:Uncharacterized protein n=1 Tax=Kitasatospora cathayae TaxID=3004092 RepID=A0ABY7QGV8_9ACTN|nr:hypothetical protein [Kitasatospora sp. HUAS 3-15]WBP91371.1 hypothetical protein O1G21_39510 [Kitasatospora sp. HUAS 3-15]